MGYRVKQLYRSREPLLHRSAIATNDAAAPSTNASGVNCEGMKWALIDVVFAGTTTSADLTPLFWNPIAGKYVAGSKTTVTASGQYKVEVNATPGLYILIDGLAGASPNVSIYCTPIND